MRRSTSGESSRLIDLVFIKVVRDINSKEFEADLIPLFTTVVYANTGLCRSVGPYLVRTWDGDRVAQNETDFSICFGLQIQPRAAKVTKFAAVAVQGIHSG